MRMKNLAMISGLLMLAGITAVQAKDRLELDETNIQGTSELPKVLYIVPWKKTSPDEKPVKMNTMVDEVMAPVDRNVLRRQIRYYKSQQAAEGEAK